MQKKHTLTVQKRELTGRKIKQLRRAGILPANVFGKTIESVAVQMDLKTFNRIYSDAGDTSVIELTIEGDSKAYPVLVAEVQYNVLTGNAIHADFHHINLKEKVEATIPLMVEGEAPAVEQKVGALMNLQSEVDVKALPMDLPEHIVVDITTLTELDQEIRVKDLKVDTSKIEITTDPEMVVAKIGALVSEEAQELEKEEEAAASEASAEAGEAAEGEKAPEGEAAPAPKADEGGEKKDK